MTSKETVAPGSVVIVGAGAAGRAAAALLPEARIVACPEVTAWHAEPGRLWVESVSGVAAVPFTRLLLCADEPLLLVALGCAFANGRPVVDANGETSQPGIFGAGAILGAETAEEAARQGRIAAAALAGLASEAAIAPSPAPAEAAPPRRLDPLDLACLLEGPPGPERNRAALTQAEVRGAGLSSLVAPARPVGFAALAGMAPATLEPRGLQEDSGTLGAQP